MLLQTAVGGSTGCSPKHPGYSPSSSSPSLCSLPIELHSRERDVATPSLMTSSVTSSLSAGSDASCVVRRPRSASLPNVGGPGSGQAAATGVRFYCGSLRHKDSILLRKSKLRHQIQQFRASSHRLPATDAFSFNHVAKVLRRKALPRNFLHCRKVYNSEV